MPRLKTQLLECRFCRPGAGCRRAGSTRLKRERHAAELTQIELSRLANVTQGTVSKLEKNKMPRPSANVLASLAWALQRCGRKVSLKELQPKRQPRLVRGLTQRVG